MTFGNVCRKHVDGVKFLKAPKCLEKRALWEESLGCKLGDYSKICEPHFRDKQWLLATKNGPNLKKRRLNEDAVLFLLFLVFVNDDFQKNKNVKQILLRSAENVNMNLDIKKFYFKIRIYFRIKNLNKRLASQKQKQRLLSNSKLLKIKL